MGLTTKRERNNTLIPPPNPKKEDFREETTLGFTNCGYSKWMIIEKIR
jgi:hypothetical protein